MTTYEVPVIVTVIVERDDDGTTRATHATPDQEGGPWAFSGYPAAYDPEAGEWHDLTYWPDEDAPEAERIAVAVSEAAYEGVARLVGVIEPVDA